MVGSHQIHNIPVLDAHELSAGKLIALIDRKTGRDIFDAYHLLTLLELEDKKLRLALVIYSAISRKVDLRKTAIDDINVNMIDLKNRLVPLLKKSSIASAKSLLPWAENLIRETQKAFNRLLPLSEREKNFLTSLLDQGKIEPELLCDDKTLIQNIHLHPALKWSAQQWNK